MSKQHIDRMETRQMLMAAKPVKEMTSPQCPSFLFHNHTITSACGAAACSCGAGGCSASWLLASQPAISQLAQNATKLSRHVHRSDSSSGKILIDVGSLRPYIAWMREPGPYLLPLLESRLDSFDLIKSYSTVKLTLQGLTRREREH